METHASQRDGNPCLVFRAAQNAEIRSAPQDILLPVHRYLPLSTRKKSTLRWPRMLPRVAATVTAVSPGHRRPSRLRDVRVVEWFGTALLSAKRRTGLHTRPCVSRCHDCTHFSSQRTSHPAVLISVEDTHSSSSARRCADVPVEHGGCCGRGFSGAPNSPRPPSSSSRRLFLILRHAVGSRSQEGER